MQNQELETEAQKHGYKPDEYREILRRAQRIRADQEERLSSDALAESAAEVGIREEDLQAAEAQLRAEKAVRAQQKRTQVIAASITAAVLALVLLFSYGSLNTAQSSVEQARANLQSSLQRRADVMTQLAKVEGSPAFRSTEAYRDLMAEVSGSENRINVARTRFNSAAADYNRSARSFPTVLVRPLLGFPGSVPLFEATVNVESPPVIPAK